MADPQLPHIDFDQIGPPIGERLLDISLPNQRGEQVDVHAARQGRRALFVIYRSADW